MLLATAHPLFLTHWVCSALPCVQRHAVIHWNMDSSPGAVSLEKTYSSIPRNHQLPITMGGTLCAPLPFMLEVLLFWSDAYSHSQRVGFFMCNGKHCFEAVSYNTWLSQSFCALFCDCIWALAGGGMIQMSHVGLRTLKSLILLIFTSYMSLY